MVFGFFKNNNTDKPSFFSIDTGTTVVIGLFGVAAVLFGFGYAFRPIEEIIDDRHDSDSE